MASGKNTGYRAYGARKNNTNTGMIGILIVVSVLLAVLLFAGIRLNDNIARSRERNENLRLSLAEENYRTGQIEARREYMTTDDFVKEAAKSSLGLVEEGEIIFRRAE